MGTKTQATAKDSSEKRPNWRCDDCERHFLTLSALKSHTMAKHPDKYKQMQSNEVEPKEDKKTALVPPTSRVSKRLQQQKKSTDKEVATQSKTVFQCPKCEKEFNAYFPAIRHIKNRHCEDEDGNPVSPDSPDLIKPIRKEDNLPDDTSNEDSSNDSYCCLACQQVFHSVAAFNEHVENIHNESITVVILSNMIEFQNWKKNMETKTRVKYLTLSSTTQKQYYQCNYVSPQNSADVTHLCPSVMILREFSKGIHVRYHKNHEHSCEKQKDANTTNVTNKKFDDLLKSNEDVYTRLKDLMKSMLQRASKLKSDKLQLLYNSALEMETYLNSLDEQPTMLKPNSVSTINNKANYVSDGENRDEAENEFKPKKVMTDDQIVKALEGTRVSSRLKRKSEGSPTPEPKTKLTKKQDTNTGLKENNSQIDLACNERFESPKPNIQSPFNQSPSFNDSYKQFIDSTVPKIEKQEKQIGKKPKKEIVKTRMGQFTPSPKKEEKKVKFDENVVSKKKKNSPPKSIKDVKLEEVEYEVVEQENDCNILILKI